MNADNPNFEPTRYSIEIFDNHMHHNALGYSGTAGNSVYAHHNDIHHNLLGMATDSVVPGHPGMPQDHARWSNNKIYSNNENYYARYVHTGACDKPIAERGYVNGVVCPVIPMPVTVTGFQRPEHEATMLRITGISAGEGEPSFTLGPGADRAVSLVVLMTDCERVSSRAGSMIEEVRLTVRGMGVLPRTVLVRLPERVRT